ncbi:ABC transporter permease subunit [Thermoplasma sp.]|uniref:ABC transporter permease subunit n=1 Tax=Thermoplasma sp. TaxID=1973142 RepID=UPI00126C5512|nr:ABC transporter permease subunit [Thermoplasma sp.]KAA8922827.1 MAG: ABC transporter permease subunit [Thermoplasma sp.]
MNEILLITLATLATAGRVLGLILISIFTGWFLAYAAIKGKIFENIYISLIEVFESVPVISFFPIVLIIFVTRIGGPLGVEMAADFLVFTAVVWNIWIGEYQAFKTVPREMLEVAENYQMSFLTKMRRIFIPFSYPRIAANLFPSVSDGFFYITVSEVFSVGIHTYQTFGIGTVLDSLVASGQTRLIYIDLAILAVVIILIIIGLREFSRYAVSKYTVDTDAPIIRRGRLNVKQTTRLLSVVARNPLSRLAGYYRSRAISRPPEVFEKHEIRKEKISRYTSIAIGVIILGLILYSSVDLIISVPHSEWGRLFSITPRIVLYLLYDYLRVGVILAISFVIAIFLGYYLAMHSRAEGIGVPIIQALSAYPPPIYLPFIFAASFTAIHSVLGAFTDEFYVLSLGFVSTFYYIFYSFWMGVKALPAEYFEVMKNLNMGYFSRMRSIILPGTFPYLISGISSTINSAWGGLMIGEYWPDIVAGRSLEVHFGLMKFIDVQTNTGNIALAGWGSFIFGIVVAIYSILFTRRMMDLARKRYVAEEGVFAA